jgi:hypothetical protein
MSINPTESTFVEKYRELDEQTLREIARGHAPWREHERYVHAARSAARRVLRERGCKGIPWVPLWDIRAAFLPGWVCWMSISLLVLAPAAACSMWIVTFPDKATDTAACASVVHALEQSDVAQRVHLDVRECVVARAQGVADGESLQTPIRVRACVQLDDAIVSRFQAPSGDWECRAIQRFLPAHLSLSCGGRATEFPSVPRGPICGASDRWIADLIEQPQRRWQIHLR